MREFRLRPSAAAVWHRCHGSIRLSHGQPDTGGDATVREQGTAAHWVAHERSKGIAVPTGARSPNGVDIDDDMLAAVDTYMGAVAAWPAHVVRYFEQAVHCADIHDECGGTSDVFGWDALDSTIYVGDFKYGFRFVDVYDNYQLACYANGAMRFFGLLLSDVRRFVFVIVQPRAYGHGGTVRYVEYTPDQVAAMWRDLAVSAVHALSDQTTCTTNTGCVNCDGRHRCTALQAAAMHVLDASAAATPDDLAFTVAENELRMLEWARDVLEARYTGLQQQVYHGLRRGNVSRHYELQDTETNLQWRPGSEPIVRAAAALLGKTITKPDKLITPTQAQKVLGKDVVAQYAVRHPAGQKMVKSDVRKWTRKLQGN